MPAIDFHSIYKPQIAIPLNVSKACVRVPASPRFGPYVRNFWGSAIDFNPRANPIYANTLIVPDTCFDIIFIKDNSTGYINMLFAALNDAHRIENWDNTGDDTSIFAISFYFWSLHCLVSYPMANTLNKIISPFELFPSINKLAEKIFSKPSFIDRILIAEDYLAQIIDVHKFSPAFLNCVDFLIRRRGVCTLTDLSDHVCYSKRQVQRIFINTIGVSPKKMTDLVRYQFLWQEMLNYKDFDYMSAVVKHNYVDQSHLIADFKKFHSTTPREAIKKIQNPNGSQIICR